MSLILRVFETFMPCRDQWGELCPDVHYLDASVYERKCSATTSGPWVVSGYNVLWLHCLGLTERFRQLCTGDTGVAWSGVTGPPSKRKATHCGAASSCRDESILQFSSALWELSLTSLGRGWELFAASDQLAAVWVLFGTGKFWYRNNASKPTFLVVHSGKKKKSFRNPEATLGTYAGDAMPESRFCSGPENDTKDPLLLEQCSDDNRFCATKGIAFSGTRYSASKRLRCSARVWVLFKAGKQRQQKHFVIGTVF